MKQELLAKIFSVAHIGATGLTAVSSALAHSQQNESVLLVTSAPEPPVSTANASGSPHCCAGRRRPSTIVAFGGCHLQMLHSGHLGPATSVSNSTPLDRGAQARYRRQSISIPTAELGVAPNSNDKPVCLVADACGPGGCNAGQRALQLHTDACIDAHTVHSRKRFASLSSVLHGSAAACLCACQG